MVCQNEEGKRGLGKLFDCDAGWLIRHQEACCKRTRSGALAHHTTSNLITTSPTIGPKKRLREKVALLVVRRPWVGLSRPPADEVIPLICRKAHTTLSGAHGAYQLVLHPAGNPGETFAGKERKRGVRTGGLPIVD